MLIKFFAYLRNPDYTGVKSIEVEGYKDIYDLTHALCDRYGSNLRKKMLSEDGEDLGEEIIILINGRHVAHCGGIHAPLSPNDLVTIFPVVAGG